MSQTCKQGERAKKKKQGRKEGGKEEKEARNEGYKEGAKDTKACTPKTHKRSVEKGKPRERERDAPKAFFGSTTVRENSEPMGISLSMRATSK